MQFAKEFALRYLYKAVKLADFFQPELAETLARQRKDYGLSDKFEAEFQVENLSQHAAVNSPINNMSMESYCGLVEHKTAKKWIGKLLPDQSS